MVDGYGVHNPFEIFLEEIERQILVGEGGFVDI